MSSLLCVDVGSTFTKGLLIDLADGRPGRLVAVPTTIQTDVMDGVGAVRQELGVGDDVPSRACSSAGGGLRLAVVGYESVVTGLAGQRVGLTAGARVVHVSAGRLDRAAVAELRAARPDLILLVGGTDGGNADVLLHNATRLAKARLSTPIVLAGNASARDEVLAALAATDRRVTVADNVLPAIGVIAPDSARAAIREAFLTHVIGGKGLSRDRAFATLVRRATPDAVLRGIEVLAATHSGDVILVDIGGATTDVYSVLTPQGEDAELHRDVVASLRFSRTVEADLGMRWSAAGVLDAADRESLPISAGLAAHADRVTADVGHLPDSDDDWALDLELARLAAVIGARRHGRPGHVGEALRPLRDVTVLLGSGGVLRNAPDRAGDAVLQAVLADHGGGWQVPRAAAVATDASYVLFAVGLLADEFPSAAAGLARTLLG